MQEIVFDTQDLLGDNGFNNGSVLLPWVKNPFQLWSLEDMLKIAAERYIMLGEYLNQINCLLKTFGNVDILLVGDKLDSLVQFLVRLREECNALHLTVSPPSLANTINRLSFRGGITAHEARGEVRALMNVVVQELKSQLFLYILPHHAIYYLWDKTFSEQLTAKFQRASRDLAHAGNCFALEEYTACVYHSMRATEFGLRAMASHLKIELSTPLELSEWGKLIQEMDDEITKMQKPPKTLEKDEEIIFCSHAVSLFKNWKNAYRNPSAHARKHYEEAEAKSIMERTRENLEHLGTKLSEPQI
jgi:HEPN domain-containing protein